MARRRTESSIAKPAPGEAVVPTNPNRSVADTNRRQPRSTRPPAESPEAKTGPDQTPDQTLNGGEIQGSASGNRPANARSWCAYTDRSGEGWRPTNNP